MDLEPIHTGILGVNTYIVPLAGQAVMIVDPACSELTGDENVIIDYLESNDLVAVGVVLTHGHFDHVAGLKSLKAKWPELCVAIHEDDAECIGSSSGFTQEKFLGRMGPGAMELVQTVTNLPEPDVLLKDQMTLDKVITPEMIVSAFNGTHNAPDVEAVTNALSHWKVYHTPGHSKGCVCYFNDAEKILLSGDTIFYGSYGRTDLYGGDELTIKKSICRIAESLPKETKVYPGHDMYGFELEKM